MNFEIVKMNDPKYVTVNGLNDCVVGVHAEIDSTTNMICTILCFDDHASQYIHLRKNQLDIQFISVYIVKHLYMFWAYLQSIIRRYNGMDTAVGTPTQPGQQTVI